MRCARWIAAVLLGSALLACAGCHPRLRKVHTEHLGQLTGTQRNDARHLGMTGTDLGVSFMEPAYPGRHRLMFLFGDSWVTNPSLHDRDGYGWVQPSILPGRDKLPHLYWIGGNEFTAIDIPQVNLGGMNVPVEGVAIGDRAFVFASTGYDDGTKTHCCSALAHTEGPSPDYGSLVLDHVIPTNKFVNISAFVEGDTVWIFGSGPYRKSDVYLARVAPAKIADRGNWEFYRGGTEFGPGEDTAKPVVVSGFVGELSVRPHPQLGYLMLYNSDTDLGQPRGIHLRRADRPWGPWDNPINIFDCGSPGNPDRCYGYVLHQKLSELGYDDGLAEPGRHRELGGDCTGRGWREECWGGEYGPYLVPEWFTRTPDGGYSIVYTLSSWVPYQVHLMRTVLAERTDTKPVAPACTFDLPAATLSSPAFEKNGACTFEGWQGLGDAFGVFRGTDNRCRMTTFTTAKGDNAMGALYQDFKVDCGTQALRFLVHGGEATVRLHRGEEIVRETRGRSGHAPRNSPDTVVCWQLGEYAGDTLRVAIFDGKSGPWGFIGATGFEFLRTPCPDLVP